MSEEYPLVQVSFFIKDDQYVLRGSTAEQVAELAEGVAAVSDRIADGVAEAKKVLLVKHVFTKAAQERAAVGGTQQQSGGQRRAASGPPPGRSVQSCEHGEMVHRSGEKNGKQWSGHFCPDNVCDPVWPNRR